MGRAQEFANIACFPVPDASYATGCVINVDGRCSSVV
jgi:NAD(P)-dependent dehydrogenase (short-subunit alcohol dehydrogenase family)